jgi:hypothetical protein
MIARHLAQLALAHEVQARVAEMRDEHAVVVEKRGHQCGAHAGVLRLVLRRLIDRAVRAQHLLAQEASRDGLVGARSIWLGCVLSST